MSDSNNIFLWKQKSEIDYIPLFIPLWLSLNAWLRDSFKFEEGKTDRDAIEWLKRGPNKLYYKFSELIKGEHSDAITFRGYFSELHHALENADIKFHKLPKQLENSPNKKVSFENTILVDSKNKDTNPKSESNTNEKKQKTDLKFETVIRGKRQQDKIKISPDFYIDENIDNVFRAYIENLYQVRCTLFHGDLPPSKDNERVIRALYLTLQMIMESV